MTVINEAALDSCLRLGGKAEFGIKHSDYEIKCKIFCPSETVGVIFGVHGFAGDKESSVLSALAKELNARGYSLICFDFPAHGKSEADDSFLRVDACKRDLLTVIGYFMHRLGDVKYGIFATSFGGYITLLCADELRGFKVMLRAPAVTMARSFIDVILPISYEEFIENGYAICGFDKKMRVSVDFYNDLLANPPIIPDYPICIIHGTADDVIPYSAVKEIAEQFPTVELITVEAADHRFKRKGELDRIIEESIKRLI